jgi:hypothetical protein
MDPVGLFGFCNIYSVYMCQSVVNEDTLFIGVTGLHDTIKVCLTIPLLELSILFNFSILFSDVYFQWSGYRNPVIKLQRIFWQPMK